MAAERGPISQESSVFWVSWSFSESISHEESFSCWSFIFTIVPPSCKIGSQDGGGFFHMFLVVFQVALLGTKTKLLLNSLT